MPDQYNILSDVFSLIFLYFNDFFPFLGSSILLKQFKHGFSAKKSFNMDEDINDSYK